MNKLLLLIWILTIVLSVELTTLLYIKNTFRSVQLFNNEIKNQQSNAFSFANDQVHGLSTLLNFYSSVGEPVFVSGSIYMEFVGIVANISQTGKLLALDLCQEQNGTRCTSISFENKLIRYVNTNKVTNNNKVKIRMEYKFLEKQFTTTITQLK